MSLRIAVVVALMLVIAETTYIAAHRERLERFKVVDDTQGLVMYDSVTGQLCRSFKPWEKSSSQQGQSDTFAEVVARTPTCADIR